MSSKERTVRERVVNFFNMHNSLGKKYVVEHFTKEGIPKRTIYDILKRGSVKRTVGSGRKAKIMTKKNLRKLKAKFNNKSGVSQNQAAKLFNCSQQYISKSLKMLNIKARKKQKSPCYTDEQITTVKSNCRWMLNNLKGKKFILDDESYFTLSKSQMSGNDVYYTDDPSSTSPNVKYKMKKKFEPKVMLYIAVSCEGISEPYFKENGLAINQETYQNECLAKILIPFIRKFHYNDEFVFWPDKASSHYAKKTIEFLNTQNIPFVPKMNNPTNVPQCRPIEDFFGYLSALVYENGWHAKSIKQLKRKIKTCIKKMNTSGIQRACSSIRTKLRKVADYGPYVANH